jgi:tetratricopeptide (TPR) repeat protein
LEQARPASGIPLSNAPLLKKGETVVDTLFDSDPVLRTHMLLLLAERYQENQQFDAWRRVLQRAYDDARGLRDVGLRARATCAWAAQFTEGEEAGRALRAIDDVLPLLLAQPEQSDAISTCLQIESLAAKRTGDTVRALRSAQRAVSLEEQRGATANRVYSAVMNLASAYVAAKRFGAASDAYRRASALIEPQGLAGSVRHAVFLNNWSVMLQNAGQHAEGAAVAKQAVEMARRADSENGASLTMLGTWANALAATGGFDDAEAAIDESLVKARAAGSVPRLFTTLVQAIILATESGDLPRAERLLAEARQTPRPDLGAVTRGNLELSEGRVALARGEEAGAVAWTRRALDSFASLGPNQTSLLSTQTFLARCLNGAGQFAEALTYAERSLVMATERLGDMKHSSTVGAAQLEVATARYGLGDVDVARTAVAQAIEHLLATVGPNGPHTLRAERLRASLPPAWQQ